MKWGNVNGWAIETFASEGGYWLGRAIKGDSEILVTRRDEKHARDAIISLVKGA